MPQSQFPKIFLLCVLTLLLHVDIGCAQAANAPVISRPVAVREGFNFRQMTEEERNSAMCVAGATAGMATAYIIGPSEVIMLVVGGVVVPSSSAILFSGLFGTIAAAGCAIGELATPATAWLYKRYFSGK